MGTLLEDRVIEQWEPLLNKASFPVDIPDEPLQRDIAQLTCLNDIVSDVVKLSNRLYNPDGGTSKSKLTELNDAEKWAARAVHAVARHAGRIADSYFTGVITDERYTALVNTEDGKPPLTHIAENLERITRRLDEARGRFEHKTQGRKNTPLKKAIGEIQTLFRESMVEVKTKTIEQGIKANRHKYVDRREKYENEIRTLEELSDLSELPTEEVLQRLATWKAPSRIMDIGKKLGAEEGLLPGEKKNYIRRADAVKETLKFLLPALRDEAIVTLDALIGEQEAKAADFITFEDGIETNEQEALKICYWVTNIAGSLSSRDYYDLIGQEKPDTKMTSLEKRGKSLHEQTEFFRENKQSFTLIAEALSNDDFLSDSSLFKQLTQSYGSSFGRPSWQRRRSLGNGVYGTLKTLEDDFLDNIRAQLTEAAESLRLINPEEYEHGGVETSQWHDFIEMIKERRNREKSKDRRTIYSAIGKMGDFETLEEALETPHQLIEGLSQLQRIGRRVPLFVDYSDLTSWYHDTLIDLDSAIHKIPEELQNNPTVLNILDEQREILAGKLSNKLTSIPEPKDLHNRSGYTLSRERLMLTDLLVQSKDVDDEAREHLQNILGLYETEDRRRSSFAHKFSNALRRILWGNLPSVMYVPDVNFFFNDPDAIANLGEENGVVLLDSVLQEWDNLKESKNPDKSFRAREATRGFSRWTGAHARNKEADFDELEGPEVPTGLFGELKAAFRNYSKKRKVRDLTTMRRPGLAEYINALKGIPRIFSFNSDYKLMNLASGTGLIGMISKHVLAAQQHHEYESWRDKIHIIGSMKLKKTLRQVSRPWAKPRVVFISMDDNASHAAAPTPIAVEPYRRGSIMTDPKALYTGYRTVDLPDSLWRDIEEGGLRGRNLEAMMELSLDEQHTSVPGQNFPKTIQPNEFVVAVHPDQADHPLSEVNKAVVARHEQGVLVPLSYVPVEAEAFPLLYFAEHPEDPHFGPWNPLDPLQLAAGELLLNPEIMCCSIVGGPGTGKTLLATGAALSYLRNPEEDISELQYTRPNASTGEKEGFLPGTEKDKQLPRSRGFVGHLEDAFRLMDGEKAPTKVLGYHAEQQYRIDLLMLAHIRGMDIDNTYRILDEGQNTTFHEMRTWLSRHAYNSKSVMIGDLKQTDNPSFQYVNGLLKFRTAFIGNPWFGHITFQRASHRSLVAEAADRA